MNQTIDNTRGYNGNILLKRANQNIEWTPDLVQEWVKCSEDPLYFIQNYMKIITLNEGLKLFKPWPYQENMIKSFVDNRYSIVTTARQAGKCFCINTPIKVRNKKTGEIIETTIGEFHERVKEAK